MIKTKTYDIYDLLPCEAWSIKKMSDTFYKTEKCDDIDVNKFDYSYMEMSKIWSENSHCKRMKVGCIIVKDRAIISDGYNGTPTGFDNCCEDSNNVTVPEVLHAEANAISKLARSTQSSTGSDMYVTLSPCMECSKLIIQSGIKRILFNDVYRNIEPIEMLIEAGIEVIKIRKPDINNK